MKIAAPDKEPTEELPCLTGADLHRAETEHFPEPLSDFARHLEDLSAAEIVAAVPEEMHATLNENAEKIVRFLDELRRVLREAQQLKVLDGSHNQPQQFCRRDELPTCH